MRIDCHCHTSRFSGCAVISPDELLEAATDRGLDGLVLTEHDKFWPPEDVSWLRRAYPELRIFNGVEVTCGPDHVVVLLPEPDLSVIDFDDLSRLSQAVADLDGYAFVAHPFRFNPEFDRANPEYELSGLEVISSNMPGGEPAQKSVDYARRMGVEPIAASDAHGLEPVGDYYLSFTAQPSAESELVAALNTGEFTPVAPGIDGYNLA